MNERRTTLRERLRAVRSFAADIHVLSTASTEERPFNRCQVAERFRNLRRRGPRRLTQAKLGSLIGVCRQAVNKIERGHVTPHPSTWVRFLDLERRYKEGEEITRILQSTIHWDSDLPIREL